MKRGLRMSHSEFSRIFSGKSADLRAKQSLFAIKSEKKRPASEIIRAVSTARTSIRGHRRGIELRFDGARLATLNDLLAMSVQERRRYRKAWHKLLHEASIENYDCRPPGFPAVGITLTRFGPRQIDPDAIIPKAPIDGLRYSGFIPEDTAAVVRSLSLLQALGDYAVVVRLSTCKKEDS